MTVSGFFLVRVALFFFREMWSAGLRLGSQIQLVLDSPPLLDMADSISFLILDSIFYNILPVLDFLCPVPVHSPSPPPPPPPSPPFDHA